MMSYLERIALEIILGEPCLEVVDDVKAHVVVDRKTRAIVLLYMLIVVNVNRRRLNKPQPIEVRAITQLENAKFRLCVQPTSGPRIVVPKKPT